MNTQTAFGKMLQADAELAEAIAKGDAKTVKRIATGLTASAAVDMVTVCDVNGRVIARGHSPKAGDVLGERRLSAQIPLRQGKSVTGIEPGNEVRLTLASGAPVMHDGTLVGAIVIGVNLSSGAFVEQTKQNFGVENTVFLGDVRIATTLKKDGRPAINTQLNNAEIYNRVMKDGLPFFSQSLLFGETYDTAYWPWQGMSGKNEGFFFIGLSRADIAAAQNKVVMYFILIGSGIGLALIVLGVMFSRALVKPLREATAYAEEVAGGNFEGRLEVASTDEVGILAKSLGRMVSNLKQKIAESEESMREAAEQAKKAAQAMNSAQSARDAAEERRKAVLEAAAHVEGVVETLLGSAESLGAQVETSRHSADVQRQRVVSSAAAMEQMSAATVEVARSAGTAAEGAERAREKAVAGAAVAENSIKAFEVVQKETIELRNSMNSLGTEAEGIGEVITVINDIADQTNLLALNAAIEAARAGEAGRGFAVVADEVRKLAEKTMDATKEVEKVVQSIQHGTRKSIASVESASTNLASATDLVHRSGSSLSEIVYESIQVADRVRSIATAAEEQSAVSEEIVSSLADINRNADETAAAMLHSETAVQGVRGDVTRLRGLVAQLRNNDA